jgi:hypothetical protein
MGYELERSNFWFLFSLYTTAFAISYYLLRSGIKLNYLIALSFSLKLIFLFAVPELSQDFYRFIWDGMLTVKGYNPYLHLPIDLIGDPSLISENLKPLLYEKMGQLSATNYSTYPPIAQLVYSFSYYNAEDHLMLNIIMLRLINIGAEIGITYLGLKILNELNLSKHRILYFIMNPLVILESSFSLHFEVVMLLFLTLSLFYIYKTKVYKSAIGLATAIASKLMPLMFIPLFFSYFNTKSKPFNRKQNFKFIGFCALVFIGIAVAYSFLWDKELILKNSETLSLYFSSFEFNASIYYVLRWIGFQWTGYNTIAVLGKALSLISLGFILYLSFKNKKISFQTLLEYMLWASTFYYLFSTTVHPWYLMLPLLLSVFTRFNYMLIWSGVIFLSYSTYSNSAYEENLWLISIEYVILGSIILYEVFLKRKLFLCGGSSNVNNVAS